MRIFVAWARASSSTGATGEPWTRYDRHDAIPRQGRRASQLRRDACRVRRRRGTEARARRTSRASKRFLGSGATRLGATASARRSAAKVTPVEEPLAGQSGARLLHRDGEAVALEDRGSVRRGETPLHVEANAVEERRAARDLEVQGARASRRRRQRLLVRRVGSGSAWAPAARAAVVSASRMGRKSLRMVTPFGPCTGRPTLGRGRGAHVPAHVSSDN